MHWGHEAPEAPAPEKITPDALARYGSPEMDGDLMLNSMQLASETEAPGSRDSLGHHRLWLT